MEHLCNMWSYFHHLCVLPSGERTWLIVNHHDGRSERLLQLKDMGHIKEVAHLISCSLIKESTRMIYQQPHAPTSLAFLLKLQIKNKTSNKSPGPCVQTAGLDSIHRATNVGLQVWPASRLSRQSDAVTKWKNHTSLAATRTADLPLA